MSNISNHKTRYLFNEEYEPASSAREIGWVWKILRATLLVGIPLMLCVLTTGCDKTEAVIDTDTAAVAEESIPVAPDVPPETIKYGMLIDMTTSIPKELGTGLVASTINVISIPELSDDISSGMPALGAMRFYVSFVDANPLKTSNLPSSRYTANWTIPAVYPALPPEPDLADKNVTYEEYDAWTPKAETYRAQYQARADAINELKTGLAAIDLVEIRATAMASGIPASFDNLVRVMAASEGDQARIIIVSDLVSNSDINIASPTGMNGSIYGVIASYGTAETEAAIDSFNAFAAPYGLGEIIPYRPEAETDAISAWLSA
jgi:hypothetical protein